MFHSLLPRAFAAAFPTWAAGEPQQEEDLDVRKMMQRKVYRAKLVLQPRERQITRAVRSWVTEPLDHLWLGLQWLDSRGWCLLELQRPTSPFAVCITRLCEAWLPAPTAGPLLPVVYHYGDCPENVTAMLDQIEILTISATCRMLSVSVALHSAVSSQEPQTPVCDRPQSGLPASIASRAEKASVRCANPADRPRQYGVSQSLRDRVPMLHSGHMYWQFVLLFRTWPYPLAQLIDKRVGEDTNRP